MAKKKDPKWIQTLIALKEEEGACSREWRRGIRWCRRFKTFEEAWGKLDNLDWMMWLLAILDPRMRQWEAAKTKKRYSYDSELSNLPHGDVVASYKATCALWRKYWGTPKLPEVKA